MKTVSIESRNGQFIALATCHTIIKRPDPYNKGSKTSKLELVNEQGFPLMLISGILIDDTANPNPHATDYTIITKC